MIRQRNTLLLLAGWVIAASAEAAIIPQPGIDFARMKHLFVELDDAVYVEIDASVATPRLIPLLPGDSFDPAEPWAVLNGKGFNRQYGWLPEGFTFFPPGGWYWIEQLDSSAGLEVYQAAPEEPGYAPIFGTAGSPTRWKWETASMVHNHYAAEDIVSQQHWARYRVYVGDETTGEPIAGYDAAEVLIEFAVPGDFDNDGVVDAAGHQRWSDQYGESGRGLDADANGDGLVNAADYTVWRDKLGTVSISRAIAAAVPEPSSFVLITAWLSLVCKDSPRRRGGRGEARKPDGYS